MNNSSAVKHENIRLVEEPEEGGPLAEAALRERIERLKDLALTLWQEVRAIGAVPTIDMRQGVNFYEEVHRFEVDLIKRALQQTSGHQVRAARLLGLKVTTLNSMIKRYGLTPYTAPEAAAAPGEGAAEQS